MDRHSLEYWKHTSRERQGRWKSDIPLQIEKAPKTSGGDLTCHVFSLEDAMAYMNVTDPEKILTIEM